MFCLLLCCLRGEGRVSAKPALITDTALSSQISPSCDRQGAGSIHGGAPVLLDQHPLVLVHVHLVTGLTCPPVGQDGPGGGLAEHDSLASIPILGTHQVVQHGVQGGGQVVEAAREVHEVLVEGCVESGRGQVFEVDIFKTLEVKGSPRDEEENDNRN